MDMETDVRVQVETKILGLLVSYFTVTATFHSDYQSLDLYNIEVSLHFSYQAEILLNLHSKFERIQIHVMLT